MLEDVLYVCFLGLTCFCQAVIGLGVGQHFPASVSTVLDAAVCTFHCEARSLGHFLRNNTQMSFTAGIK